MLKFLYMIEYLKRNRYFWFLNTSVNILESICWRTSYTILSIILHSYQEETECRFNEI